jgi:hypothetical protein
MLVRRLMLALLLMVFESMCVGVFSVGCILVSTCAIGASSRFHAIDEEGLRVSKKKSKTQLRQVYLVAKEIRVQLAVVVFIPQRVMWEKSGAHVFAQLL